MKKHKCFLVNELQNSFITEAEMNEKKFIKIPASFKDIESILKKLKKSNPEMFDKDGELKKRYKI